MPKYDVTVFYKTNEFKINAKNDAEFEKKIDDISGLGTNEIKDRRIVVELEDDNNE